jgi:hypothetical protein
MQNKKAQIFSMIAIAIILLFFVSYEVYSTIHERQTIKTRVQTMDSFLFSLEQDLSRQLYISGFRTIFLAETEIARTGSYISNFSSFFQEAINNGTISGVPSSILDGAKISDIQNNIQENARKMNIIASLSDIKVSVSQEDPWNVVIYFNATLNLTDENNLASWYKNESIKAFVTIENFEDPFFLLNTQGKITRKIIRTLYEGDYVSGGDKTNLSLHIENKYYANNTDSPSFLNRLQGLNIADANGIESFVYIPDLTAQTPDIPVLEKSLVDHIYFSSQNPSYSYISGLPSWFKIDSSHCPKYQLSC